MLTYGHFEFSETFPCFYTCRNRYYFSIDIPMPEGDTAEIIASLLVTLGGTLASAYLAKKLIDAMDMSKKVYITRIVHLRM